MMIKALLAWAGLRAMPHLHDNRIHDTLNDDTATIAGFRVVARRSLAASAVMTSDPANTPRVNKGISDMREITAEVARRADR